MSGEAVCATKSSRLRLSRLHKSDTAIIQRMDPTPSTSTPLHLAHGRPLSRLILGGADVVLIRVVIGGVGLEVGDAAQPPSASSLCTHGQILGWHNPRNAWSKARVEEPRGMGVTRRMMCCSFQDHESLRKSEARNAAISQGRSAPRSTRASEITGKDSADRS